MLFLSYIVSTETITPAVSSAIEIVATTEFIVVITEVFAPTVAAATEVVVPAVAATLKLVAIIEVVTPAVAATTEVVVQRKEVQTKD